MDAIMGPKAMTLSAVPVPLSGGPNGQGALVTAVPPVASVR